MHHVILSWLTVLTAKQEKRPLYLEIWDIFAPLGHVTWNASRRVHLELRSRTENGMPRDQSDLSVLGHKPEFSSFSITKKIVLSSPAYRCDHDYQFPDNVRRGLCLRLGRSSEYLLIEYHESVQVLNTPKTGLLDAEKDPLIMIASWAMEPSYFYLYDYHKRYCYPRGCLALPHSRQLRVTVSPTDFYATISLD